MGLRDLSLEVERVVTAPYAVSLQKLNSILHNVPQHEIRQWANGRCDISLLCTAVLANLQTGPWTLAVIRRLSCILSFRNCVVEQEPLLLNTLLGKASASEEGYDQYATVCTALLSIPLDVSVPATLPAFMERILARAVTNPSADNIRPVHLVLSGVGCGELWVLSQKLVMRLQEQLKQILGNLLHDAHLAKIFCLAIMARLSSMDPPDSFAPKKCSSTNTSCDSEKNHEDYFRTARKWFVTGRASKALDMVALTARHALSQSCSPIDATNLETMIEILTLCTEIVGRVNGTEKRNWLTARTTTSSKPLLEKVLRADLKASARPASIAFMIALYGHSTFQSELHSIIKKLFQQPLPTSISLDIMRTYIEGMDEPTLASNLLHMMNLTTQQATPTSQAFAAVDMAINLASEIAHKSTVSQDLRHKILYLLSTNAFLPPLQAFTSHTLRRQIACHVTESLKDAICPMRYVALQQKLQQTVCLLLLQTALYASNDELGMEPWLATALLEKQVSQASNLTKCDRTPKDKKPARIHLFEVGSTPEEMPSHAWRDRLRESSLRDAEHQQQSVAKIVSEVCRDLEARCDDAERPYREEHARAQTLESELRVSLSQLVELQAQKEDSLRTISSLEAEKHSWQERADVAEVQVQKFSREAEELSKAIEVHKIETADRESTFAEAARKQDLDYMATLDGKDEDLEIKDAKINELETKVTVLEEDLDQSVVTGKKAKEDVQRLEEDLKQRCDELNKAIDLSKETQKEVGALVDLKAALAVESEYLRSKIKELEQQIGSLESTLDSRAAAFEMERTKIQRAHDDYKSAKAVELGELRQIHLTTIHQVQEGFEQKINDKNRQHQERVSRLEKKRKEIEHELEHQTKIALDAQRFQHAFTKFVDQEQQVLPPAVPRLTNQDQPPSPSVVSSQQVTEPNSHTFSKSFGSGTSSRSGSTPKRPKTISRRSFKTPLRTTREPSVSFKPLVHKSAKQKQTDPAARRRALGEVGSSSANKLPLLTQSEWDKAHRRHTIMPTASKESGADADMSADDLSFNDHDIFTSTRRERLSLTQDENSQHQYDDGTTVDI